MYVCRSPFDLFLSAAPPSCTHLRICRQALPIIATLPSSETDGGKFCIDIHTEEEGVGAGCEASTPPPHIKQQPCKILGSQEKEGFLRALQLLLVIILYAPCQHEGELMEPRLSPISVHRDLTAETETEPARCEQDRPSIYLAKIFPINRPGALLSLRGW